MKNFLFTLIALAVLAGLFTSAQMDNVQSKQVVSTPPIVATSLFGHTAYVLQVDAKVYTCPVEYGVYIQDTAKHSANIFQYVAPGQQAMSTAQHPLLVACLKIQ